MPRLTAAQLREPLIDGAVKAARSLGHRDATKKSLFENPESDESGEAAAALLKEVGPGGAEE